MEQTELLHKIVVAISKHLNKPIFINLFVDGNNRYSRATKNIIPTTFEIYIIDTTNAPTEKEFKNCSWIHFEPILYQNTKDLPENLYNFILSSATFYDNQLCKSIINSKSYEIIGKFTQLLFEELKVDDVLEEEYISLEDVTIDYKNKIELKELISQIQNKIRN